MDRQARTGDTVFVKSRGMAGGGWKRRGKDDRKQNYKATSCSIITLRATGEDCKANTVVALITGHAAGKDC